MALFGKYIKYSLRGNRAYWPEPARYLAHCSPAPAFSTTRLPERGDNASFNGNPRHRPSQPLTAVHKRPQRAVRGSVCMVRC